MTPRQTAVTGAAQQQVLDFYSQPEAMSSGGDHAARLASLPDDIGTLARVVQGLTLHEYAASAYGVTVAGERRSESHIRGLEPMLNRLSGERAGPLTEARPPEKRLVGVCRHFALLLVGILRGKGIPARARCGFGSYFNPPYFEDHWVCEYWNAAQARWIRVDAQLDDVFAKMLMLDFDPLDVPHDRFVIAGDAWAQCRAGEADAATFGIFVGEQRGLWFIAGDLVRDLAALNKMEMLAWDCWGAMPRPGETLQQDQLAFFDRLAALTRAPDASFKELRELYADDERLRVPATVFNAVLERTEAV